MGAKNELSKCITEINQNKIKEFPLKQNADWIRWKMNPPLESCMGGVWERQIRSAHTIILSILKTHSTSLNDESLNTFTEIEAIGNSRPLVDETINDVTIFFHYSPLQCIMLSLFF